MMARRGAGGRRASGILLTAGLLLALVAPLPAADDPRDIAGGWVIPDEGYCDQPYVVVTKQGHWLCTLTTGPGVEGQRGQHVAATISTDQGRTWSPLIPIEPGDGPEASWVMPLVVPATGRVYAFYTYNGDNLREVPNCTPASLAQRVDTLGQYAYRYSDDGGRTWSKDRHTIPMRPMRIDRENNARGKTLFFWGVGKPIVAGERMYLGFAKVGKWGLPGAMVQSQGCFLRSDNILSEGDASRVRFELLPDGDAGLRAPKGPVSDEANLVSLSDGTLYATYRTIDGYPCHATSRDGGHTWTPSAYMTYEPGGTRRIKHPRAANFVKKFSNGKYLYWFHNQGGEAVHASKWDYYQGRNPAWICGGVEKDGGILWSQPEILLYDPEDTARISYPDFIEDGGRVFVTETQKTVARVHPIDPALLEAVWTQHERAEVAPGAVLDAGGNPAVPAGVDLPLRLSRADLSSPGAGLTVDAWVRFDELSPGQVLLDARDAQGRGFALETTDRFTVALVLNDGPTTYRWDSDPGTHAGTLKVGQWQHLAVIVDGGPRVVSFVVDGAFNDGGAVRQYGWGRFPKGLGNVGGGGTAKLAPKLFGQVKKLRVYDRALLVSEVVGNARAGMK